MDEGKLSSTPPDPAMLPTERSNRVRKFRKGTHSCFECRRRKTKCVFAADNPKICKDCLARGSRCIEQEHADAIAIGDNRKNLRERVSRLESLLETLLAERPKVSPIDEIPYPCTPLSDDLVPATTDQAPGSLLTLFDNAILARAETVPKEPGASESYSGLTGDLCPGIAGHDRQSCTSIDCTEERPRGTMSRLAKEKDTRTRNALLKLLPPLKEILETLQRHYSEGWVTFRMSYSATYENEDIATFTTRILREGNPAQVGIIAVFIATSSERADVEELVSAVHRLIINDDEYAGTLDGLECLVLLGKLYTDIGQPRRAWLTVRRGLTLTQLNGLHRNLHLSKARTRIWRSLYIGDRIISLMLGLPYAVNDAHCNMETNCRTGTGFSPEAFVWRVLSVVGKIIDRNQNLPMATFSSTMQLDHELETLELNAPPDWWNVAETPPSGSVESASRWQEQIFGLLCFHQARVYLHMPWMLKSVEKSRYEYSRRACINGAREMLKIYIMLCGKNAPASYQCRAVDFLGFTAAFLLGLGVLGFGKIESTCDPEQDRHDWGLVDAALDVFKSASTGLRGKVAAQCHSALRELSGCRDQMQGGVEPDPATEIQIVIPYFGKISVRPGNKYHHVSRTTSHSTSTSTLPTGQCTPQSPKMCSAESVSHTGQHHSSAMFGSDPCIAYQGFYSSMYDAQRSVDDSFATWIPEQGDYIGSWPNPISMDIDQDWSWFSPEHRNN